MDNKEKLFNTILAESKHSIFRICLTFVGPGEELNDLRQEIYLQIWKSMERFQGKSALTTYVYRIAYNTAIKFKTNQVNSQMMTNLENIPDSEENEGDNSRTLEIMHRCIQQLPDQDKLLISFVLEELSYKEIAAILQINVNHVGVKINRVKNKLSNLMMAYHGEF